jgi:hypothetical protein
VRRSQTDPRLVLLPVLLGLTHEAANVGLEVDDDDHVESFAARPSRHRTRHVARGIRSMYQQSPDLTV